MLIFIWIKFSLAFISDVLNSIHKLEILRMIFLKIDEDNPIEEVKKCRLVSPRFYKAVQDLFQDEFVQKCCTQFDGSKYNYTKCRAFGMNIFGSYKLNFSTLKISRSEYYLMKSWLEKVIPTNVQTLELKDNQLDWKEVILVLKKFSSIVNLKFLQTSEDMKVADQIFKLFEIKSEENTGGYKVKVKEHIAGSEIFLPNLKSFEAHIVHFKVLNILSYIISRARCQLESFSIIIDLKGVCQSPQVSEKLLQLINWNNKHSYKIESLNYFKKFSKWLKNLEIKIFYSDAIFRFNPIFKIPYFFGYDVVYKSILRMFLKPDKLKKFTNIENLKIKLPFTFTTDFNVNFFDEKHKIGLFAFVKNQTNLQKFALSPIIPEPFFEEYDEELLKFRELLRNLMVTPKSTFEFRITDTSFEPILGFSENLSKIKIGNSGDIQWHFSDPQIPVFRNCTGLAADFFRHNWVDFEIRGMIEKFPNLTKLAIMVGPWGTIDQILTTDDLQLIITHYKNLKSLYFENLKSDYDYDSGLTGLSLEAIEARKENPGLPIEPEDRVGFPISHLKNLESLAIKNDQFLLQISDVSAHHAFDKMPNLRQLNLKNTNITRNGFETILEKTKSKNLYIRQLD